MGGSPHDIECRRKIGVMMQEVELTREMRVRELIALTASYYPNPLTPEQAMELTHITALGSRSYNKLSGGQKRQVQFALAVCGRPELLFLDEPTVGLDVQAREVMWADHTHAAGARLLHRADHALPRRGRGTCGPRGRTREEPGGRLGQRG